MVQLHMSEAEIAKDFAAALEKVRQGIEVIVEKDHQPVAVLRPPEPPRRTASEILALLPKESIGVMDEDFARDVQEAIDLHQQDFIDGSKWD